MKNFFYFIVFAIIALSLDVQSVHAAFPVHKVAEGSVSVKTEKHAFEEFVNSAIEKYHRPVAPVRDTEDEGGKILNIAALGLGMTAAIALIAAFLAPALLWVFGTIAVVAGLAAIITGAYGMELSPLRGLGITGFVLGIATLSAIVIIGIIAFLLLLALAIFL